jgi:sugar phosphate isomerase/epimerase
MIYRRIDVRLSIWTSFYADLTPKDALVRLARLGWKNVEISAEHGEMATQGDDWKEQLGCLRNLCEQSGITLWQMHAPLGLDIADLNPKAREKDIKIATKWIYYAHELNIPYLVIHPGGNQGTKIVEEESVIYKLNLDSFKYLATVAEEVGVKLCIENMQERENRDPRRLGAYIYDLNELIDEVGSGSLGICFDTSHANVTGLDMYNAINECGKNLLATHISDNNGSGDQHKMPFVGNINWSKVALGLTGIGYNKAFNLEISGENRTTKGSEFLPLPIRDAKLNYAKEIFRFITDNNQLV